MKLVLWVAVAWILWAALTFLLQRKLLYPGTSMQPVTARDGPPRGAEQLWLEHDDGRAEAWLLPARGSAPGAPRPALVFFHGNGEFIDDWGEALRPFPVELGVSLLLVEYPGYGRSTGRPTEDRITSVATSAWDRLAARPDVDPERMVAMGRSLGGGPAAALARLRDPAALVLLSTFTDVADVAVPRFWVPAFLVRDRFRVLEAVRGFRGPVLVMHGRNDAVIPVTHGHALAGAGDHVTYRELGCAHNDCPPPGGPWWEAVAAFLTEAGVLGEGER